MLEFIICLVITVSIHELAHMLVALKCGIGVKAFSIGFGKPYLHKEFKGIDFRLSPLPFGGYCDIKGMESKTDKDDFLAHPYSHKFAVLVAGVTANLILACICYLIHYRSISVGLTIDWIFIKALFTKNYTAVEYLVQHVKFHFFLLQLSILNLFCGITNLLPFPALDGGHLWIVLMERVWKDKFILWYKILNTFGFLFLIVLQIWILYYVYFN